MHCLSVVAMTMPNRTRAPRVPVVRVTKARPAVQVTKGILWSGVSVLGRVSFGSGAGEGGDELEASVVGLGGVVEFVDVG